MGPHPDPGHSRADERFRRSGAALVTGFFLADGLLRTAYFYFGARATGGERAFLDVLVSEMTASVATATVFFVVVVPFARRWPLTGPAWARHMGVHVAGLLSYSVLKTLLMWGLRVPFFRLVGLGQYDYGDLSYRFPMEGASDVLGYALASAAVHVWDRWQSIKNRELQAARLESQLNAARLRVLQSQLQPHFLFNTLNTIGAVTYEDPAAADRMITRLADLLRRSLDSPDRTEVTVQEEVLFVNEYLEIMRARYGDRLRADVHVEPGCEEAVLPPFLLQPLVENAIKYAVEPRLGGGRIDVHIQSSNGALRMTVTDDGPGSKGQRDVAHAGSGLGLSNTRDRLRLKFGDGADLSSGDGPEGGYEVTVRIPLLAGSRE